MRLIRGNQLSPTLQRDVLARYVHRWTIENARQTYEGACPACAQSTRIGPSGEPIVLTGVPGQYRVWTVAEWHAYHVPLTTDREWLAAHAFAVTRTGQLDRRSRHAHPASLAE